MKKPQPRRPRPKKKRLSAKAAAAANAPRHARGQALDANLDKALTETFPASDPIAIGEAEPPAKSD